jgi:hypothetical protein
MAIVWLAAAALVQDPSPAELIERGIVEILKAQEDSQWPYEGVYRVRGEIPVGYRIGGTSIAAGALLAAAKAADKKAAEAIERALAFVLKELAHPLMRPSVENAYDVRVWGHACALEFLCRARAAKRAGARAKEVDAWIDALVKTLVEEELPGGGWNYGNRNAHAAFVTAPVTQALLLARSQGEKVPDETLERARRALESSRVESGAFLYSGRARDGGDRRAQLPGSIARSPAAETTLLLLGGGSLDAIRKSLDAFHEHWEELEKRRQQPGTHEPPYYFYFGHLYAAQAIEMLPKSERPKERKRLLEKLLRTRDADGTWNDRVFARSRAYGTSCAVLALLGEKMAMPPTLKDQY